MTEMIYAHKKLDSPDQGSFLFVVDPSYLDFYLPCYAALLAGLEGIVESFHFRFPHSKIC